ncbi:MAG TPA: hypothetical protein VNJ51_13700 [Candidatus Dormibacteraeota bacterium]|nr:hypothetical protein [Candidatus Dormibacteraeota bacterium]
MIARRERAWPIVLLAGVTLAVAMAPPILEPAVRLDVRDHHIAHAIVMAFGAALGLALAASAPGSGERPAWLVPVIVAPLLAMALMNPASYEFIELRPVLHATDHLALAALAVLTSYGGQRYQRGVGWAAAVFLELMALGAAFGFGVAPPGAAR